MSEAAWNKAFTQGSSALKKRLMDVHAKNPKFQSWLKSSGHGAGVSVKQASKEIRPSERSKKLAQQSLKAYGATKGTRMGSPDGTGETLRDTIVPLSQDQRSKVAAAEREAKAAAKKATPAAPKKPLSKTQRMAAIAAAVRKSKTKHDVPTMDPDDEGHDDLRDLHQSLHVRRGYNEEVEQVDESKIAGVLSAMEKNRYIPQVGDKIRTRIGGQIPGVVTRVIGPYVHFTHPEGKKYKTMIHNVVKEEKEDLKMSEHTKTQEAEMNEVTKKEAEAVLGGSVKEKPKMPPGKQPAGYRYVRSLARKALKAGLKKEEVEQVNEMDKTQDPPGRDGHEPWDFDSKGRLIRKHPVGSPEWHKQKSLNAYAKEFDALADKHKEEAAKATNTNMRNFAKESAKRAKSAATMLRSGESKEYALKHYQGTLQKEEVEQTDESRIAGVLGAMADVERRRQEKKQVRGPVRKPEKDDREPHPIHGDIGLSKGEVRDAAYHEGFRHGASNKHGSQAHTWGAESEHYNTGFMAGRNDSDRWHKNMSKITRTNEEVEQVDEDKNKPYVRPARSASGEMAWKAMNKHGKTQYFNNKAAAEKHAGEGFRDIKEQPEIRGYDNMSSENNLIYIEEKLTAADPASKWISDFVKSDNPKFAGKSKKERIQQALGAYYAAKRGTNEEVEQIDELKASTLGSYMAKSTADEKARREKGVAFSKELSAKTGMKFGTPFDPKLHSTSASRSANRALALKKLTGKAKVSANESLDPVGKEDRDVDNDGEYDYEGDMAKSQLRSIMTNAKRLHDMLEDNTNLPEWVQSKITLAEDYVLTAANYMEGEMNEEVEQIDELKKSTLASYVGKAAGRLVAASRLQRDFEKDGNTVMAGEFDRSARKKRSGIEKAANKLAKEEAEGKVAVTPKEKELAAHHGDKSRITYGDVIKARLKSAAAKAMNKGK